MHAQNEKYHLQTAAIRCGHRRSGENEHNEPIFTTSSFIFEDSQQASDLFAGEVEGNVYSRFTNPTVSGFENRLAALEGARYCIATASGMVAYDGSLLPIVLLWLLLVAFAQFVTFLASSWAPQS